ncbi:Periplasmic protein TorT precursor [compost metagenome]
MLKITPLLVAAGLLGAVPLEAAAAESWKFTVRDVKPPRELGTAPVVLPVASSFAALSRGATGKHRLCLLLPSTKDRVFQAYIYGAVDEAKRLGQALTVHDAGGFEFEARQHEQFDRCLAEGAQAILLQPVNPDGWESDLARARQQGVKVINATEGVNASVDGRALASFQLIGHLLGAELSKYHPAGGTPVKVVVLPGSTDQPFAQDTVTGLREGLKDSSAVVAQVVYGTLEDASQRQLVEEVLAAHPDVQYIIGNAIAIKQAVPLLAKRGLSERVKLISTYLDFDLLGYIHDGKVLASAAESSVMIKRIAVNLAVAAIEGKGTAHDLIAEAQLVTQANSGDHRLVKANFAPMLWKPVYQLD